MCTVNFTPIHILYFPFLIFFFFYHIGASGRPLLYLVQRHYIKCLWIPSANCQRSLRVMRAYHSTENFGSIGCWCYAMAPSVAFATIGMGKSIRFKILIVLFLSLFHFFFFPGDGCVYVL